MADWESEIEQDNEPQDDWAPRDEDFTWHVRTGEALPTPPYPGCRDPDEVHRMALEIASRLA